MTTWHNFPIFVYGTLKRDQPNHFLIKDEEHGRHEFVGTAVTALQWPLVVGTPYNTPFLLNQPGHGRRVIGELYRVDADLLAHLDRLECHPDIYTRQIIDVSLVNDDDVCLNAESETRNEGTGTNEQLTISYSQMQCEVYILTRFNKAMLDLPAISNYDNNGHNSLKFVAGAWADNQHVDRNAVIKHIQQFLL